MSLPKDALAGLLALYFVTLVSAQVYDTGPCSEHDIEPVRNFSLSRHAGHWYEVERYFYFFEKNKKCVEFNYTLRGNEIDLVKTSETKDNSATFRIVYRHRLTDSNPARNSYLPGLLLPLTTYMVFDTDYDTYSVSWGCKSWNDEYHYDMVWILSRTPNLNPGTLQRIHNDLENKHLHPEQLIRTDRSNCTAVTECSQ